MNQKVILKLRIKKDLTVINEDWNIKRMLEYYVPDSWENVFKESKHELDDISNIVEETEQNHKMYCFPLKRNIFACFDKIRLNNVKVVIIGQDPYFTLNSMGYPTSNGLAFSVNKEDQIPGSLNNIYKELARSIEDFRIPLHGDLSKWCEQGILLLNMSLTVMPGRAKSFDHI